MFYFLKNTKSISIWLICFAYIGLFFPIKISNLSLIILIGYCLIKTKPKEIIPTIRGNKFLQIMIVLYLIQVIGLLYTENLKTGFFILEKKIYIFLIPLLTLPLLQKVGEIRNQILKRIGFITLISSLFLIGIATFRSLSLNDSQAFYFENFSQIHYVYYAIYFSCGSLFLIDSLFDNLIKTRTGVSVLIILYIYSLCILILVASKTGILAFGLASIILLYLKIPNKKIFVFSIVIVLLSASIILYFNDTTRNRFTELSQNLSILTRDQLGDWSEETITGLNMRLLFWKIAVVHSWQDKLFITGTGTGDAQNYLDSLYTNPKYKREGYVGWDSHNQWVFSFIQLGFISIAALALLYAYFLREAFQRKDIKLISFLIITLCFSMSESILESNKGIVFFSLLFTLLCSTYNKKSLTA